MAEEEILRKNLTSHQFPERARTHQLRGISTVSHFLNVGQMCRDVRRRTVEGVDPETWYGRVVTSVGGLGDGKEGKGEGGGRRKVVDRREGTDGEEKRDLQERQSRWETGTGEECRTSQWSEG